MVSKLAAMGLLVFDKMFARTGSIARRRGREPRAAAADMLMAATRREVALLGAEMIGGQSYVGEFGMRSARGDRRLFRDLIEGTAEPYMVLDPRSGLHIVDINEAYAAATLTSRRQVAGAKLFEVFPDNPDDPDADGVCNLFDSIRRAAQSGKMHAMAVQRYDVQDASGRFVEKHWQPRNIPIRDEAGRLVFVLHHALDVTPS